MSSEPLPGKCGAKRRKTNPPDYCEKSPSKGRTRCELHGGKTLQGVEHGSFKHGRYTEAFKSLGGKFNEALNDPQLLDMRRPIAVQDIVVTKAAERVAENDSPEFRKQALKAHAGLVAAFEDGDAEVLYKRLGAMRELLEKGVAEDRSLQKLSDASKRLAEEQRDAWQVALSAKASFSAEEFRLLLLAMLNAMKAKGLDMVTIWAVLGEADRNVFGGRLGFWGSDGSKWGVKTAETQKPLTSRAEVIEPVEGEGPAPSNNGNVEE